jgi:hypothetical protein
MTNTPCARRERPFQARRRGPRRVVAEPDPGELRDEIEIYRKDSADNGVAFGFHE